MSTPRSRLYDGPGRAQQASAFDWHARIGLGVGARRASSRVGSSGHYPTGQAGFIPGISGAKQAAVLSGCISMPVDDRRMVQATDRRAMALVL